jgi:hypothetical protein
LSDPLNAVRKRLRPAFAAACAISLAAIAFGSTAVAAAPHLVADHDRTNVDVFDSPRTACDYWTLYRSPAGLTLLGMGGSVNFNKIHMAGLTFAPPGTAVTIQGSQRLTCPKVARIAVMLDAHKTLNLRKVRLAGDAATRYVLPENVSGG